MEDFVVVAVRFALDIAVKATVLLALAALTVRALSRRSAAVRQLVATLGLAGAIVLPVVSLFAPRWEIPLVPSPVPAVTASSVASVPAKTLPATWSEEVSLSTASAALPRAAVNRPRTADEPRVRNESEGATVPATRETTLARSKSKLVLTPLAVMSGILLLWSAGTLFALARLVVGMGRVAGIRRRASGEVDGSWTSLLSSLSERIGLERPVRLFFSDEIAVPVTAGLVRPVVLMPEGARRWNEERRRVVLLHELAHVERADWLSLLLGQTAAALYWFHPLAWASRSQMRKDCERACDDLVLAAGTRPSVYAAHLLSIIRSLRLSKQRTLPAVAMAHRSYWDGRMRAILDPHVERRSVSGGQARAALVVIVGLVALLATVAPWAPRDAEAMASDGVAFSDDHSAGDGTATKNGEETECEKSKVKADGAEKAVLHDAQPPDPVEQTEPAAIVEPAEPEEEVGFVQASRKSRKHGGSAYGRGMELHNDGHYDEAIQAFGESIANAEKVEAASYNIACGYALKGDRDLELHRFDEDFGWSRKALRSTRHRAWREVEPHFEQYARNHPDIGRAWSNLGYARIEGDRAAEAAPAFRRALELGYRKSTTLYNLACAASMMDRKDEAFTYLFQALDAGFEAHGTMRGDDDLDNLRGDPRFRQALARLKNNDGEDHENGSD